MVRFAEEARDVGRERRQHLLALVHAFSILNERTVVAEALQTQGPQPLGQTRID